MGERERLYWERIGKAVSVGLIIFLAVTRGLELPWGAYVLLIGMFFGPDVYKQFSPAKGES